MSSDAEAVPGVASAGHEVGQVSVHITYRIIELFSEGLYSSPNKAVEELVANSFDAMAAKVHVLVTPDLLSEDSSIAVIDDGSGMDPAGLQHHWVIGTSRKRSRSQAGRRPIGKFGIGKLATYVLANRLTHISKSGDAYYAVTMDYRDVPADDDGVFGSDEERETVVLPLRELSAEEATEALAPWLSGSGPGYDELELFGPDAPDTWTAAVMTDLKPMAAQLRLGTLRWVLRTAMPLRDDFRLFLNGQAVRPAALDRERVGHWRLGAELTELPKPASDELEAVADPNEPEDSIHHYGLTHPELGRVTGYLEVFEDALTGKKADAIERSNGFFIYVRGRLVNLDDPGFGIDRNQLRYGTFSRFRAVIHIDRLDEELRSSRERFREGRLYEVAQNILRGIFNFARGKLEDHIEERSPEARLQQRFEGSPVSLTVKPIVEMVEAALAGKLAPRLLRIPHFTEPEEAQEFVDSLREDMGGDESWIQATRHVELEGDSGIAQIDVRTRVLLINTRHPFVAHFLDEYEDRKRNLPLELLALSEVLLEAHLYLLGLPVADVQETLERRDLLLRTLAKSTGRRNAFMVAQDLLEAATDEAQLEIEVVAAFDSMGFNAVPVGGKDRPDGLADAALGPRDGVPRQYRISLEAKSKVSTGKRVSKDAVNVATIARHRDESDCHHAVVVGPDFATTRGDEAAVMREIATYREAHEDEEGHPGKTITLMRVRDLSRLVRLVPLRRLDLVQLRDLFSSCSHPDEAKAWIDAAEASRPDEPPYREILETIWEEQDQQPGEAVEYSALRVALRRGADLALSDADVVQYCRALAQFATGWVYAGPRSVELNQRPDKVLEAIGTLRSQVEEELGG